jgi:hypothetical protein
MNEYFDGCRDEQEIKTRFRDLAKQHHPDLGGDVETMKAVNEAYEQALKGAYRKAGMEEEKVNERWSMDEEIAAMAMKVLRLKKDLQVELCGVWLWITGNTYIAKEQLKAFGCQFSGPKKAWYWRREEAGMQKWHKKVISLEEIREKYGSVVLASDQKSCFLDK